MKVSPKGRAQGSLWPRPIFRTSAAETPNLLAIEGDL